MGQGNSGAFSTNGVFLQNRIDNNAPADVITISWGTNNTIDGFTGIRGLNELSTQATGQSRPAGGATDLDSVVAVGPIPVDFVSANWGSPGRFANPLAAPDGTPGPIAYGFNTFTTVQDGVNAVDTGGTTNVLPGTYAENVAISQDLTLTGITPSGTTAMPPTAIIQPAGGDGITISAPAANVTVADLEITGAANGINANNLATLNLSDLTLTGNTTAGGTISNVSTVNDTPLTGSAGATDTITGSSIQRGSDDAVNYSGVANLNVTGSDGSDTFNVTPAAATAISVAGGLPTPPAKPGDALNVDLTGATGATLSDTFDPASGYSGAWTFTNAMPINLTGIETVVQGPPAITSPATTTFAIGVAGAFTVTTTGSPTAAITENGALPSGVTFVDNGDGTATLSGTPAAGSEGTYPIAITASNGVAPDAMQSFSLVVSAPAAPAITSAATTTFTVGAAGTFEVTTTGSPTAAITESGATSQFN